MCRVFALYPCAGAQGEGPWEKISCGINEIHFNLDYVVSVEDISQDKTLYQTLETHYDPFDNSNIKEQYAWQIVPSKDYIIPVNYLGDMIDLWRFPLIIEYVKNHEVKTWIIDDFMFKTENLNLTEELGDVFTYEYRYWDKKCDKEIP